MKAEQLDRKTLRITVPELQNDFAMLRYLLFSSVGTNPISITSLKNSTTTPPINPYTNPSSIIPLLPWAAGPSFHRSTPEGAARPPRAKTNNSANADFQSSPNRQEAPSTMAQNLTSRISQLENLFADEIATYTTITTGIYSQYLFFYDKTRQFEAVTSDNIVWKIPSVNFVLDSVKSARPSSDYLIQPTTSFSSPIFRTHHHGYIYFRQLLPLWYWTRYWQVCINFIHPFHW